MRQRRPTIPAERRETVRRLLLELLRQGSYSARDLSAAVGIPERQVDFHLEHIRRSLQREQESLELLPARCHGCDFVFAKRMRLTRPGRCPLCRGESIQEPLFTVRATPKGKGRDVKPEI